MSTKKKIIIILVSCIVCAIAAIVSVFFVYQNHEKNQEELRYQELVDGTLEQINGIYNDFTSADDKTDKILAYNSLLAYQSKIDPQVSHLEEISTLLDTVFDGMYSAFEKIYSDMIADISFSADDVISDKREYVKQTRENINNWQTYFNNIQVSFTFDIDDDDIFLLKDEKVNAFSELTSERDAFTEDTFIADQIDILTTYIDEMNNVKKIIESDRVLIGKQQAFDLGSKVDSHVALYTNEISGDEYEEILLSYDAALEKAKIWFAAFYSSVLQEILEFEKENDNDTKTLQQQISMLGILREIIIDDGFLDNSNDLFGNIDEQITLLEQEVKDINDRLERERRQTPSGGGGSGGGSGGGGGGSGGNSGGGGGGNVNVGSLPNNSGFADEVLRLVNVEREKAGLQPLSKGGSALMSAALIRANECVVLFSHTRPDGSDCFTAYSGSARILGENIAMGHRSPEAVMKGWMDSPGHRENILRAEFTELGIGVVQDSNGTYYWAQMFKG